MKIRVIMEVALAAAIAVLVCGCDRQAAAATEAAVPAPAPAVEPAPAVRTTWNMDDVDGLTNGNLPLAAAMYMRGDEFPQGNASIAAVMKAPWNYYGQRLCFPAQVAHVDEMPPGSEMAKAMHGAGEIVAVMDDGSILDMVVVGGTGDIVPDRRLNMCGLVVGKTEVPNAVGGSFTHLVMVGKLKP